MVTQEWFEMGYNLLFTDRKLHTSFWSVPKISDLEWPWTA